MKPSLIIVIVCLCVLTCVATLAINDYLSATAPIEAPVDDPVDRAEELAVVHVAEAGPNATGWEMYPLFDEARECYPGNTDEEIVRAVHQVYRARIFWADLTVLESLRLLVDGIPGQPMKKPPADVKAAADQIYSQLEKSYAGAVQDVTRQQRQLQKGIAQRTAAKRAETAKKQRQAEAIARQRKAKEEQEHDRKRLRDAAARQRRRNRGRRY